MKNIIRKIDCKQQKFLTTLGLLILLFLYAPINSTFAFNKTANLNIAINKVPLATTNPIFYELMYKLNHHKCLQLEVSSMSINKYGSRKFMNSYTSYGKTSLVKENNTTIKSFHSALMEFSDRKNFQGPKTRESFKIYGATNTISVEIKLETWGNKTIVLRNVQIHRDGYGYFITGRVTDGTRTVYYTLGIYEVDCLI
ncbi:MAG: hypothetical protein ACWA42_03830 [Lutibacter sp.]